MPTRNVIIGGGPAGMYAIEEIRRADPAAQITLVSDEPAYARMALPYYLAGEVPEEQVFTGGPDFYQRLGVDARLGRQARQLDTAARTVALDDGATLPYDNLLLATGSRAQRLPVPGADLPGVITLWALADARQAIQALPPGAEVCLIGAGFIGFIVLNAIYKRGNRQRVVEIEDQILPRMLDRESAQMVQQWLAGKGIEVRTGEGVTAIEARDGRKAIRFASGGQVLADLVILATGVQPNIDLAREAGIECQQGILVDNHCRTSAPGVYAAGDCAQGPELITGRREVHAIQPTAVDHGRVAGANMGGQDVAYVGSLAMNILDVCGLHCVSYGQWASDGREEQRIVNATLPNTRKIVWDGTRIVGAIVVAPPDDSTMLNDVGMLKGFIQSQAELGAWKRYIEENPADLRRAYIGAGIPARLIPYRTTGSPSASRSFRYQNAEPVTQRTEWHRLLIESRPEMPEGPPPAAAG
ncbi:MAG: NAD(P)/FAD-dependent oxidoreductase [Armatimonadetes bacterium]|nr:NAD(P)/FAD-dependent oxidoreductase [Armatimonadota bacterium]